MLRCKRVLSLSAMMAILIVTLAACPQGYPPPPPTPGTTGPTAYPPPANVDLVPLKRDLVYDPFETASDSWYCNYTYHDDMFHVPILNAGTQGAGESVLIVNNLTGGVAYEEPVPAIDSGEIVTVDVGPVSGGPSGITGEIIVNARDTITESDTSNNKVGFRCLD